MQRVMVALAVLLLGATNIVAQKPHVLMISVDGMKPEYVTHAREHNLKLPVLEQFLEDGTSAEGVVGVIPTVTYPSHTTLITGVWPAEHGIYSNTLFDPLGQHGGEWNWYFRDVRAETLYEAAGRAGLTTAAIGWPATVGAPIDYLVPEAPHVEKVVTPSDLKNKIGVTIPAHADIDVERTAWAIGIINIYNPNFVLVHIGLVDHEEHLHGPFSIEANKAIEKLDQQVGQLIDAERKKDPHVSIVIVSDHGFARVDHHVRVNVLLAKAGLITLRLGEQPEGTSPVQSWNAQAWESGGTAAIMLRDPSDAAVRGKVKQLLDVIANDSQYGIDKILTHEELVEHGGYPNAAFLIDFKPGWAAAGGFRGDAVQDAPSTGTHGYLPSHPELRSAFMVMGPGVAKGRNLGVIDMRQIAPTVATILGVNLPAAKLHSVDYKP